MMTTIETYVRVGRGNLRKWAALPRFRLAAKIGTCFLAGFTLSAVSLANVPQPLAMGLVCALSGWRALVAALGGSAGYLAFWGAAGYQGLCWMGLSLAAALKMEKRKILDESPYLMCALGGLIVSASGLGFQIWLGDKTAIPQYLLRIILGAAGTKLFELVRERRDRWADWAALGCVVLALSQIAPFGFSLGYVAAGAIGVFAPLPAAALAGLALDLSQISRVSMTAVVTLSALARLMPMEKRWLRCSWPGVTYLLIMGLSGVRELTPFFGLTLGGWAAALLPDVPDRARRRGETGLVQVRLEMMAGVLSEMQQLLLEVAEIPVDGEALLLRTRERACGGCPNRKTCAQRLERLPVEWLHSPLYEVSAVPGGCKKPGRMILELRRTQEQYRTLRADRQKQGEYRAAVIQQYQFLASFLRQQADGLTHRGDRQRQRFTPEAAVCSAGKEAANGDRCACFPGTGCRYYLVLCDGMGTGLGAAQEGQSAVSLLRRMLSAGFPAEFALRSLNALLILRGKSAAVTVDLAEIYLDSGRVTLYKWGAAPSWLLYDGTAEKIGTAMAPPGLSVMETRETVERLSLRRGEVLILVSDGMGLDGSLGRIGGCDALPPGELAAKLLEMGSQEREDDATVAAVRLIGSVLST